MAGVPLHEVPVAARTAWLRLRDDVLAILGFDLVAMWGHGGTTSVADPAHKADLDTYVIVSHRPDEETARRLEQAQDAIADDHGVDWDVWYVVSDAAIRTDPPRHAWREGKRDTSWALNRAQWLAGRYVKLLGREPAEIVKAPTWEELERELDRELEHIERHVVEGDTDPHEATYAILTGSRILDALENHSVAISKRAAGTWALEHVDARWHPALRAALRSYDGHATAEDVDLLAAEMSPFVAFVRERVPATEDRLADALPRWSGY